MHKVETEQEDENNKTVTSKSKRIKTLDQLLKAAKTNLEEWEVVSHKVNAWEIGAKGPNGSIITETLFQVTANLTRRFNPGQLQTVLVCIDIDSTTDVRESQVTAVIPDLQIGFRWKDNYSYLEPMHDRVAMDVAWTAIAAQQPDEILLIGDCLDYAAWSKFDHTPDLKQTTQPALNELYWWLARLRQSCPKAKIKFFSGNHDERPAKLAARAVEELFFIKRVDATTGVMSHAELLNLDALHIRMVEPYNSEYWLWNQVRCHHGREHRTDKILRELQHHSEIQGHTHRLAVNYQTVYGPQGAKVIFSLQPGCLCRLDGPPSYGDRNDWQQGFGIVRMIDDQIIPQVHAIQNGRAYIDGVMYIGQDLSTQIARDIGWRQIAR